MKKFFVIIVLFALPLVAYLFFASGVNNFAKLPVLNSQLSSLEEFNSYGDSIMSFEDNITILGFPGKDPLEYETNAYHLAEKIYKPYYEFKDLYFVFVVPEGNEEEIAELEKDLSGVINLEKWKFVTGKEERVQELFNSLETNLELNDKLATPNVFIIDKEARLRGREGDEDEEALFGYDTGSIAVLNNEMKDDVKVILAEYRLALKKYNKNRKK